MYSNLFVAGTFDRLHAGHAAVLREAFARGETVTIGLASDRFVKKFKISNFKFHIGKYKERKRGLEAWLAGHKRNAAIVPIDDPYEPAASMGDLAAIIVTAENRRRGEQINEMRAKRGLRPLALIEVPMVEADDGKPISSTRLRNGEIDGNGRLIMPESLRAVLGNPMGEVLTAPEVDRLLRSHPASQGETSRITVGDIATETFLNAGITPMLAVIDGRVGRRPYPNVVSRLQPEKARPFQAKSGPGFISREAMAAIQTILNSSSPPRTMRGGMGGVTHHDAILIDGEEDLLVLPAIIYAPLGARVYYGQPGEGLVEVVVTHRKKRQALALLGKFL